MLISPFGTMPKRYSRPMRAPESMPKPSPARLLGHASHFSGRVKRCVTRNALLNCGSRSEVGRLINVKSGSASFSTASSGGGVAADGSCANAPVAHIADHGAGTKETDR